MARFLRRRRIGLIACGSAGLITAVVAMVLSSTPATQTNPPANEPVQTTSPTPPEGPAGQQFDTLAAEQAADATEFRDLAQRLGRLEAMSDTSGFAFPQDGFQEQVQAIDALLDRMDGEVFPGSSSLRQKGER
jgi:hypothetical protein